MQNLYAANNNTMIKETKEDVVWGGGLSGGPNDLQPWSSDSCVMLSTQT